MRARAEDVALVKVTKRVGEVHKQPSSQLSGTIVMFDLQGAAVGGNDADGECIGGGDEGGDNVTGANAPLTAAQKKGEDTTAEKGKEI